MHRVRRRRKILLGTAKRLRSNQTKPELVLWNRLRARRLHGLKFRRQEPIARFIVDFCCHERRLIIEIDGSVHALKRTKDLQREAVLRSFGFRIIRFTNMQVQNNLPWVLQEILKNCADSSNAKPPLSLEEGEG